MFGGSKDQLQLFWVVESLVNEAHIWDEIIFCSQNVGIDADNILNKAFLLEGLELFYEAVKILRIVVQSALIFFQAVLTLNL